MIKRLVFILALASISIISYAVIRYYNYENGFFQKITPRQDKNINKQTENIKMGKKRNNSVKNFGILTFEELQALELITKLKKNPCETFFQAEKHLYTLVELILLYKEYGKIIFDILVYEFSKSNLKNSSSFITLFAISSNQNDGDDYLLSLLKNEDPKLRHVVAILITENWRYFIGEKEEMKKKWKNILRYLHSQTHWGVNKSNENDLKNLEEPYYDEEYLERGKKGYQMPEKISDAIAEYLPQESYDIIRFHVLLSYKPVNPTSKLIEYYKNSLINKDSLELLIEARTMMKHRLQGWLREDYTEIARENLKIDRAETFWTDIDFAKKYKIKELYTDILKATKREDIKDTWQDYFGFVWDYVFVVFTPEEIYREHLNDFIDEVENGFVGNKVLDAFRVLFWATYDNDRELFDYYFERAFRDNKWSNIKDSPLGFPMLEGALYYITSGANRDISKEYIPKIISYIKEYARDDASDWEVRNGNFLCSSYFRMHSTLPNKHPELKKIVETYKEIFEKRIKELEEKNPNSDN